MAKKNSAAKSSSERRPTWKGNLSFGLVSFPVQAFNVVNKRGSDIHFHQLHAKCHSRIHYEKVCPIHGKVSMDEIVSGYEYEKGKYVEIDPDELDEFRTTDERALKIDAFVKPETVDPIYFDGRMYYLLPANKSSEDAYTVVLTAMRREECYGVGQVVFSGKEQLALIRPVENLLHMAMLNYVSEITPPEKMEGTLSKPSQLERQLKLAQALIRDWSNADFDLSSYVDEYREKVEHLIESKVKGKKVVTPKTAETRPATISLMDALKKSVERHKTSQKSVTAKHRKPHSA